MNKLFHSILPFAFVLIAGNLFANIEYNTPPDTTTNFVDKAAAAYNIEEGKTLYMQGKMKAALIKFREAGIKDPNSWKAAYWISKCHYRMDNYGYSLKYANEALELGGDKVDKEIYYALALAHHRLGNIDSALVNYTISNEKLSNARAKTLQVDLLIQECHFAKEVLSKDPTYIRERLVGDINSGYDEYGAIMMPDGKTIYFTSRRSNTTGGGMNPDDQRYFEDSYKTTWDDELKEWSDLTNNLGKINSNGFDAINYISPDGLYGVMTLNSTAIDIKTTTRGSDICELKMSSKGTWNSPRIINNKTINTTYFEGSATLTADGNTMYFVTDRKGEKSSTDIYVVEKNGKSWGDAKPLPMTINTEGRETTPFITPDGRYLFFSSDGHVGMGGLDVYVVENKGGSWGTPVNMGHGVNTVNNDTHFFYQPETKRAMVSGFRVVGEKASIDIYGFDMSNFTFPTN